MIKIQCMFPIRMCVVLQNRETEKQISKKQKNCYVVCIEMRITTWHPEWRKNTIAPRERKRVAMAPLSCCKSQKAVRATLPV